jgi:ATP-dependent DNA helicase RecQ
MPADAGDPVGQRLHAALREVYGYSEFRPQQESIVRALLDGRDAFVVMPTGGGKSLCYQLPARLKEGTALVVSPLISLMKDQVDAANANGLSAAFLNSSQDAAARREVARALRAGELDLLYVSPERLAVEGFSDFLKQCRLSFIAVDEAHCISEWGHDFRPDYLALGQLTELFPALPVAAFTATATMKVQQDIITRLRLRDPLLVRASFNRPNLFYRVIAKHNPNDQIAAFIQRHEGESGIVYRTTRASVEETAAALKAGGIKALPYHAGLDDAVRVAHQEAFNRDEVQVVVATIAFGMGIDKSNVRYVIHGDLPKNIEGYYQETGRGGRDGDPAQCLLLFSYGDIPKLRFFMDKIEDEAERRRAVKSLNDVVAYASAHVCRRKQLLGYFGEAYDEPACGGCDICAGDVARTEATREAQMVLSAIARTGERFGTGHILDVVTGANTERIRAFGHDQLKTYGVGRDRDKRFWRRVVDALLAGGHVEMAEGEYPVLLMGPSARAVLTGQQQVYLTEERTPLRKRKKKGAQDVLFASGPDGALFEQLRKLRHQLAQELGVPAYVVFTDRTLHEMARLRPTTPDEMLNVSGVGARKLSQFATPFLTLLKNGGVES